MFSFEVVSVAWSVVGGSYSGAWLCTAWARNMISHGEYGMETPDSNGVTVKPQSCCVLGHVPNEQFAKHVQSSFFYV